MADEPDELPDALARFYEAHAQTGEPTDDEVARAELLVVHALRRANRPLRERRLLRWQVIAVVVAAVGATLGVAAWRRAAVAETARAVSRARGAFEAGRLADARRALEACGTFDCQLLASRVAEVDDGLALGADLDASDVSRLERLEADLAAKRTAFLNRELRRIARDTDRDWAAQRRLELVRAGVSPAIAEEAAARWLQPPERLTLRFDSVVRDYRRVMELVPGTPLAISAQRRLSRVEALPAARPGDEFLMASRSAAAEQQFDSAARLAERCVEVDPTNHECLFEAATLLLRSPPTWERYAERARALRHLRVLALRLPADDDRRAQVLETLRREEQGIRLRTAALSTAPDAERLRALTGEGPTTETQDPWTDPAALSRALGVSGRDRLVLRSRDPFARTVARVAEVTSLQPDVVSATFEGIVLELRAQRSGVTELHLTLVDGSVVTVPIAVELEGPQRLKR